MIERQIKRQPIGAIDAAPALGLRDLAVGLQSGP